MLLDTLGGRDWDDVVQVWYHAWSLAAQDISIFSLQLLGIWEHIDL